MTLRAQLLLLQALIVCLVTVLVGSVAGAFHEQEIRDSYKERMQAVAQSIARLPAVIDAFDDENPSRVIQPIAEVIREASDLEYVVVANDEGIRYSHPTPSRIGERVSTDPSVPLAGEIYVGTQTGTLGTTWRVKVPIFKEDVVIGTASVGILESVLVAEFVSSLVWLLVPMGVAAVVGVFAAVWVTRFIRRRIYSLEPYEIAALVKNRETTMHRLSEGVIVVEGDGMISLVNDAAADLLGSSVDDLTGAKVHEALPSELVSILNEGEASGRPVIVGPRVVVARSTGAQVDGASTEATLLLRDHTELHDVVQRVDAADAIIAFRERQGGLPKGLSAETLERIVVALTEVQDASASEVGEAVGISRVSARRYLEHLSSSGRASRDLDYSTKGRPSTRYRAI